MELLTAGHQPWSRFDFRETCVDLLHLHRLFLKSLRQRCDCLLLIRDDSLLRLEFSVSFEKLIEQHRVHLVIADSKRLALVIARHEIGSYLGYFLGHQAKLWFSLRI